METTTPENNDPEVTEADWVDIVRSSVANLRFGSVQITVHKGRVTHIESVQKTRFFAGPKRLSQEQFDG